MALELHMRKHPEAIKGTGEAKDTGETRDTAVPKAEIKALTKEAVVQIAKIDDPFLSKPIQVYAHIETPETKGSMTDPTATGGSKDTAASSTADTKETKDIGETRETKDTKETVVEPSRVEPQKKTVKATSEGLQSIHIHMPASITAEGRRDQPRMVVVDESKGEGREPVIPREGGGLPAQAATHEVELSTASHSGSSSVRRPPSNG